MRLGSETGSLTNHILSRAAIGQPEPEVGMGATILAWTDRYAATIVSFFRERGTLYVVVQSDHAKRTDTNGMSECQNYDYAPNPNGAKYWFRRGKTGAWQSVFFNEQTNRWNKIDGCGLRIGEREEYYDFSF